MNTPQLPAHVPPLTYCCPRCHRGGFTRAGLRLHRCPARIPSKDNAIPFPGAEYNHPLSAEELTEAWNNPQPVQLSFA